MSVKRCRSAFSVWTDGVPRVIAGGELVDETDPVYAGHEHFFEDAAEYVASRDVADVEDATAAPGERRQVTAPARRGRPPKNRDGGD